MERSVKMTNAKSYNYYVIKLDSPDKFKVKIKCVPKEWIREYLKDDYVIFRYPDFKDLYMEIDLNLIAQREPPKKHWPSLTGHILFKCATFHTAFDFMEEFEDTDDESNDECEQLKYDDDETEDNISIEKEEIENSQKATRKRGRREENDEQSSKENNKPKVRRLSNKLNKTIEEMDEQNILIVSKNQNPLKMTLSLTKNSKNKNSKTCHNELTRKENPRELLTPSDTATSEENANAAEDGNTELHQHSKLSEEVSRGKESVETAEEVAQAEPETANKDSSVEQILSIKNGKQNYNVNDIKHVYNTIRESKIKLKNVYYEIRTNLRNAFATVGLEVPEFCDHLIKPMLNTN